jgi:hypothetical protein
MLAQSSRPRLHSILFILLSLAGCGDGGADAEVVSAELSSPDPEPAAVTPCGGGPCVEGVAGVRFINGADALRQVELDGAPVCVLQPGEECAVPITAADKATIHVTDEDGTAACDDPSLTLAQCVCAVLKIRC